MSHRSRPNLDHPRGWPATFAVASVGALLSGAALAEGTNCTDDAILVFDASGSMASAGYNELEVPRIFDALDAARRVLPQVTPYRRLGLIVYGPGQRDACSNIDLVLPPAANAAGRIIAELEALRPNGDTPLTAAVAVAAEALNFRERPSVVVLVTDGEETCGGVPCQLGSQLHAEGFATTVHVIGFKVRDRFFHWNSQAGEMTRQSAGQTASSCLADKTGGIFVSTETTDELVEALQKTLGCPVVTERQPDNLSISSLDSDNASQALRHRALPASRAQCVADAPSTLGE
ncbi:MAG: vWA domain-containing protein [Hyphomicrobium sp.]